MDDEMPRDSPRDLLMTAVTMTKMAAMAFVGAAWSTGASRALGNKIRTLGRVRDTG